MGFVRRSGFRSVLTWGLSLVLHGALLAVLAFVVFARVEQPETEAVVLLPPADVAEWTDLPRDGTAAGGRPAQETVSEVNRSTARAAAVPAPPLPADLGAPALTAEAHASADPASMDPAFAVLAELAPEATATATVGSGSHPAADGVGPGALEAIGRIGRQGLDVVFVLDATDSMADEIAVAKDRALDIHAVVTGMLRDAGGQGPRAKGVRFGVVAFKDYGDDYGLRPTRQSPLSAEPDALRDFLQQVFVGGGGDLPEPLHVALAEATNAKKMGWRRGRHNIVVLVTDAPVHTNGRKQVLKVARDFARQLGGTVNVIDANPDRTHVLADLGNIAAAGGGSAFRMEDVDGFWKELIVSIFRGGLNTTWRRWSNATRNHAEGGVGGTA